MEKLNPGSKEAQDQGCTCPILDNNYGEGVGNPPQFWMHGDCPLHGVAPIKEGETKP